MAAASPDIEQVIRYYRKKRRLDRNVRVGAGLADAFLEVGTGLASPLAAGAGNDPVTIVMPWRNGAGSVLNTSSSDILINFNAAARSMVVLGPASIVVTAIDVPMENATGAVFIDPVNDVMRVYVNGIQIGALDSPVTSWYFSGTFTVSGQPASADDIANVDPVEFIYKHTPPLEP